MSKNRFCLSLAASGLVQNWKRKWSFVIFLYRLHFWHHFDAKWDFLKIVLTSILTDSVLDTREYSQGESACVKSDPAPVKQPVTAVPSQGVIWWQQGHGLKRTIWEHGTGLTLKPYMPHSWDDMNSQEFEASSANERLFLPQWLALFWEQWRRPVRDPAQVNPFWNLVSSRSNPGQT